MRVAVVTGASSGIGAATGEALAAAGYRVVLGARRKEKLQAIAAACGGQARSLDVTRAESVERFCAGLARVDLLVNNAGGALGLDPIETAVDERWRTMWETNVLGLMRVTRALLPALRAAGEAHLINIGSTSSFEVYPGGGGYTSVKHAVRAITRTLRLELLGEPIRITQIDPGLVETEFSRVRFFGDEERAAAVYAGMTPLTAADVAEAIVWAVSRPPHVNVDEIVLRPLDQATSTSVHRRRPPI